VRRQPKISIVIPVRNEIKGIGHLLDSLTSQDLDHDLFEIIVADGRSTDGTAEYVRHFSLKSPVAVTVVDNPGIRSSAGRNAGLINSAGEVIVFIDGHCHIPSKTLLRDTLSLFESSSADCLCRPQPLVAPASSETGKVVGIVRASRLGHGRDSLIYDMNRVGFVDPASSGASYRRRVFDVIGMFDERYDACEDVDLNIRLRKSGMAAYTDPRLAVYYEPRNTVRALFVQMLRYGRGRIRLAVRHFDVTSVSYFAPLLLVIFGLSVLVSIGFGGAIRFILLGSLLLYVATVLSMAAQLARTCGSRCLWQAPVIYFAIHLGLGIGMFAELLNLRWTTFLHNSRGGNNRE
jgi:succinoglycan biosynthesis protein ExoA